MKIYVASSWKNFRSCRGLGAMLREKYGFEVYVFCDEEMPACKISMDLKRLPAQASWTAKEALANPMVQGIYVNDRAKLDSADLVLLVLPSGKSAHMEAGIKKGQGGKVVVFGPSVPGDWDTMYLAFDAFFTSDTPEEMNRMLAWFEERSDRKHDSDGGKKRPA